MSDLVSARGTDVITCWNASVNFTTLLTKKSKAWQTFFTTDKSLKKLFFFSFPVARLTLWKGSNNDFLSSINFQLPLHEKDHQQRLY